jgi:hypothetical protein
MLTQTFPVPFSLGMPRVLDICRSLDSLPEAVEYELDFSRTQHFEPFGMLLVASAVRRLRRRVVGNGRTPIVASTRRLAQRE